MWAGTETNQTRHLVGLQTRFLCDTHLIDGCKDLLCIFAELVLLTLDDMESIPRHGNSEDPESLPLCAVAASARAHPQFKSSRESLLKVFRLQVPSHAWGDFTDEEAKGLERLKQFILPGEYDALNLSVERVNGESALKGIERGSGYESIELASTDYPMTDFDTGNASTVITDGTGVTRTLKRKAEEELTQD